MRPFWLYPAILIGTFLANGCTRYVPVERGPQAYYRTGFPTFDTSERLERILESVMALRVTAKYRSFRFAPDAAPVEGDPIDDAQLRQAADTTEMEVSRRATAIVVGVDGNKILLLSTHHAVQVPDTLVEHFRTEPAGERDSPEALGSPGGRRIRSVSVLTGTASWGVGPEELHFFEVLASDERSDLAFLGIEHPDGEAGSRMSVLPALAGISSRLSWGSFVYILGYPAGYPMVTRGVVSRLKRTSDADGGFIVDGVGNRGMSGGPILAIRGDSDSVEWVGMARAAAVEVEHRLVPEEGAEEERDPGIPYDGPIYLQEIRRMLSGITLSISMDEIRRFADEHRRELEERGYRLTFFEGS